MPEQLLTVDRARAYGLQGSDLDLAADIDMVSTAIIGHCGRRFGVLQAVATPEGPDQVPTEWHRGNGRQELLTRHWPIISVESVKINDQAVTDYRVIPQLAAEGRLFRRLGWPPEGSSISSIASQIDWSLLDYNIEIAYTAGYFDLPADLVGVVVDELRLAESRRESGIAFGVRSERTPGGYSATYLTPADLASRTKSILARYCRELT